MCDFSFLKFSLKKRKERNPFSGEWWLLHRRRRRPLLLLSCFSFALLSILWSIADMSISKSSHRILASMVWECVSLVVRRGYNEKGRGWVGFLSSGTWWAIFRSVLLHPIFAQAWWCVWVGVNSSDLDLVYVGVERWLSSFPMSPWCLGFGGVSTFSQDEFVGISLQDETWWLPLWQCQFRWCSVGSGRSLDSSLTSGFVCAYNSISSCLPWSLSSVHGAPILDLRTSALGLRVWFL